MMAPIPSRLTCAWPALSEVDAESKFLQALNALFEGWLTGSFSAEEHVTYYNARVPFLLSLDEGTTSARAALYDEQGRRTFMEIACRLRATIRIRGG